MSGGLRDELRRYLPSWLGDAFPDSPSYGFRWLWMAGLFVDVAIEAALQGSFAAVGTGTPTALKFIGDERGIFRGQAETDAEYATRLRTWIDIWKTAGSADCIARQLQAYLANHPRIRIVTRSGFWVTLEEDGTITREQGTWDWDSVTNTERASFWSELWIIVYPTQWAVTNNMGEAGEGLGGTLAMGHDVETEIVQTIRRLIAQFRSAHSYVRAVIWTSDAALFDPSVPLSLPNGKWGDWGMLDIGTGGWVPSDRNITTCRYWENL